MNTREIDATIAELDEMTTRLASIRSKLDTRSRHCGECKLKHHLNFLEHLAAQQIDGAVTRIEKIIGLLRSRDEQQDQEASNA